MWRTHQSLKPAYEKNKHKISLCLHFLTHEKMNWWSLRSLSAMMFWTRHSDSCHLVPHNGGECGLTALTYFLSWFKHVHQRAVYTSSWVWTRWSRLFCGWEKEVGKAGRNGLHARGTATCALVSHTSVWLPRKLSSTWFLLCLWFPPLFGGFKSEKNVALFTLQDEDWWGWYYPNDRHIQRNIKTLDNQHECMINLGPQQADFWFIFSSPN